MKFLRNRSIDVPDSLARFQREARLVAMLPHPNIGQVFDFDAYDMFDIAVYPADR